MKESKIIIILLVVLAITVSHKAGLSNELVKPALGIILLGYELYLFQIFRKELKSRPSFQVKSYEWIGGIGISAFLVFHFSDEHMNMLNIGAILFSLIFGVLYIIRNRTRCYCYSEQGIKNLNDNKWIESSTIRQVDFNDDVLVVDTSKYNNELIIYSKNLVTPPWNELMNELEDKRKTWANKS